MTFFLSLLIWIIVCAIFSPTIGHVNPSWKSMIILFFPLWFLHAFADPMSMADTPEYYDLYVEMSDISIEDIFLRNLPYLYIRYEIGWLLLTKALSLLFSTPQALMIVESTVIIGCYAYFIKKYSPSPWLSVLIFLCTLYPQSLFVLRQHMALALCLLSVQFIIERRIKPFSAIVLLAFTIHASAIIFFLFYFLYKVKINVRFYRSLVLITIVLYCAGLFLLQYLIGIGLIDNYYSSYFDAISNYTSLIICLLEFLFIRYFYGLGSDIVGIEKFLYMQMLLCLSLSIVALTTPFGGRLSTYFSFFEILVFPLCAYKSGNRLLIGVVAMIFILFAFLRMHATWLDACLVNLKLIF